MKCSQIHPIERTPWNLKVKTGKLQEKHQKFCKCNAGWTPGIPALAGQNQLHIPSPEPKIHHRTFFECFKIKHVEMHGRMPANGLSACMKCPAKRPGKLSEILCDGTQLSPGFNTSKQSALLSTTSHLGFPTPSCKRPQLLSP